MKGSVAVRRNILFLLFLGSYLMAPLSIVFDILTPYFMHFITAGAIFLLLYFTTFWVSFFSIKKNRENGYS